jgi:hypothetical protein
MTPSLWVLWTITVENHPGERVHQYSQFSVYYRHYVTSLKRSLGMVHRAGEKLFIDFAGPSLWYGREGADQLQHPLAAAHVRKKGIGFFAPATGDRIGAN